MFEWVDKTSGETIRLSQNEAAELLNKSFGRTVAVKRGLWSRWLLVTASAGFLLLAATSWEFEQREKVQELRVTREYYVELLSWDLPPYKTEEFSRERHIQELLVRANIDPEQRGMQFFGIRDGKIIGKDENAQDSNPEQSVVKE